MIKPKDVFKILRRDYKAKTDAKHLDIDCWLDNPDDPDIVSISVKGHEPQKLALEWIELNFGRAAFFQCACGQRCSKLYLPPHGTKFKCKKCHKLKYRLANLNPKSIAGQALKRFNKINKLIETRSNISHIFYRGQYTQRFNRFLAGCKEVGLNDVVGDAQGLLDIVKVQ